MLFTTRIPRSGYGITLIHNVAWEATCRGLDGILGASYERNDAAFYLFPALDKEQFDFQDAGDFCMQFLHDCQVLVIPGPGFDWQEDLRFRIVMLPEPEKLSGAMEKLGRFLKQHRK